jgi:regulator of protease activity HflC (stomatin/prohibitin superfamily)
MSQLPQPVTEPAAPPSSLSRASVHIHERECWALSGWLGVLVVAVCIAGAVVLAYSSVKGLAALPILVAVLVLASLTIVQPGETRVVRFFGRYVGTLRRTGLWWLLPLSDRHAVSIRVRNFETNHLKVNDADGNPVEIAAIVVWQVADTSRALYAVDDYLNFVRVQAESALRHVATTHPYDDPRADGLSLRGSTDVVAGELAAEMADRVAVAGVEIVEVRISHLAYAAEIAQAMLRRQQANAVVAARSRIVDGAVGMVEEALARMREHNVVSLDEEREAAMVSNLMVVLCSDQPASPVVNTGTLYS